MVKRFSGRVIKHILTRFLADIFKSINGNGIYFESVQAEGHNIVCFDLFLFQLVEYSEKIYAATKIKYDYQQIKDSIREYSKNGKSKYISSYNEYENEKNEKKFDYLNDWIRIVQIQVCIKQNIVKATVACSTMDRPLF